MNYTHTVFLQDCLRVCGCVCGYAIVFVRMSVCVPVCQRKDTVYIMDKGLISFLWNVSRLLTIGISIRILSLKLKDTVTLSLSIPLCAHT